MKKFLLILAFGAVLTALGPAQELRLANGRSARQLEEAFLADWVAERFESAFSRLREVTLLPQSEIDSLEAATIRQLNAVKPRFGEPFDYRFVLSESVGDFLRRSTYIVRYQVHPIRLQFLYYNAGGDWHLDAFLWDDEVADLFER